MESRGRKLGSTDGKAKEYRKRLLAEYDRLVAEERAQDAAKAKYLPTKYYVDKLFDAGIVCWSKSYINKVITNRYRYDK